MVIEWVLMRCNRATGFKDGFTGILLGCSDDLSGNFARSWHPWLVSPVFVGYPGYNSGDSIQLRGFWDDAPIRVEFFIRY